jgi:hypothetical protein
VTKFIVDYKYYEIGSEEVEASSEKEAEQKILDSWQGCLDGFEVTDIREE